MRIRTTLAGTICALLVFSGMASAAPIKVYPVPWAPESGKSAMGTLAGGITFDNVSGEGEILIYTVTGEQAARIPFSTPTDNKVKWFGKNSDGANVASGVYLWVVKADDATVTGKLIVIR